MFNSRKEVTVIFHLYGADPQFTIPGIIEYGRDDEFVGNQIGNLSNHIYTKISHILDTANLSLEEEDSCFEILLCRKAYENDDETIQFVINLLIDSNPWPQRDPEVCKERKRKADAGELGQNWWIHHIDLPDGTVLDIDRMTMQDEDIIIDLIKSELENWLATLDI